MKYAIPLIFYASFASAGNLVAVGLDDPEVIAPAPCVILWGLLPCHQRTNYELRDNDKTDNPYRDPTDGSDDGHPRPDDPSEGHPDDDTFGNPGNDKPVGRAGEKPEKDMAERDTEGNRGRSN